MSSSDRNCAPLMICQPPTVAYFDALKNSLSDNLFEMKAWQNHQHVATPPKCSSQKHHPGCSAVYQHSCKRPAANLSRPITLC
eukprot:1146613-Pelagomonas_calceolata.AAC.1